MDTPRQDFKSRASSLWKERIQTLNAQRVYMGQKTFTNQWFGRICNCFTLRTATVGSTTMNISICNARELIGLKILILGAAELQIALPFGQRPLVRQNR